MIDQDFFIDRFIEASKRQNIIALTDKTICLIINQQTVNSSDYFLAYEASAEASF